MSKTDDVRNKSLGMGLGSDGRWGGAARTQQMQDSEEAAMLQGRLDLLNKQEFLRAKSNAEVIALLQNLLKDIKSASESVRSSAREVRTYPVEVVSQLSARLEACVARCEDAAKRAGELFERTKTLHGNVENKYMLLLFTSCLVGGLFMAVLMLLLPRVIG